MEAKWPFMLITFGLIFALGLTISGLERGSVMNNWTSRRCDLPVMMAAAFFKPDSDPRTKSEFAKENFDFCMKTYIDKFINLLMAPINALFGKQLNIAGNALDSLSGIRQIAATLYETLLSYLDTYYRKFNASVYEMSRIVQYLRMAMRRANAVVMSFLYSGITMFRGMLNTIQFVIKVIMIIIGIMLAIIIVLIFVLFPVIPLILAVLGAIVSSVLALSMVMSAEVAQQAENSKGGFCFSSWTHVATIDKNGKEVITPISELNIGDELAYNCGKITAVIQMNGEGVPLYHMNGIFVSGSHLVKGIDGAWRAVADDERAIETKRESSVLYCFNTTTHTIPVYTSSKPEIILFRDWEEMADDDERGQYEWNYQVLKMLNKLSNYDAWKGGLTLSSTIPLMSRNTKIKTTYGFVPIDRIFIRISNILDSKGNTACVLGAVAGLVENVDAIAMQKRQSWNTELYELKDKVWIKSKSTVLAGKDTIEGMTLITESGEFIIWDEIEQRERIVRDFTEVGYKTIHETYPFVADRLRITEQVR